MSFNIVVFCFNPVTDVQALLLSDVLTFLQEKDQKYVFASLVCFTQNITRLLTGWRNYSSFYMFPFSVTVCVIYRRNGSGFFLSFPFYSPEHGVSLENAFADEILCNSCITYCKTCLIFSLLYDIIIILDWIFNSLPCCSNLYGIAAWWTEWWEITFPLPDLS